MEILESEVVRFIPSSKIENKINIFNIVILKNSIHGGVDNRPAIIDIFKYAMTSGLIRIV